MVSGSGRISGDPFFLWQPLKDSSRPQFPYRAGLSLSIQRHTPPPPFGDTGYFRGAERQESHPKRLRESTQTAWCLQNPPVNTTSSTNPDVRRLHIVDEIACQDGRGPQIVRCYLDQDEGETVVAKIYDPLYYSYADHEFNTPVDVTWLADQHYSREAAGYEELSAAAVDGLLVPKYYGSWTFDLALPCLQRSRSVRMVLMEWVPGNSLQSLIDSQQVMSFSPQQRLSILARAMEVECRVSFAGVRHGDFALRNILLEDAEMNPRVLLIDFDHSAVFSRQGCRYRRSDTTLPINPRYRYWGPCPNELLPWVPEPHRSRPACFKGWLKSQWEHSTEFADRAEGGIKLLDYDEPVDIAQPRPDDEIDRSSEMLAVGRFHH